MYINIHITTSDHLLIFLKFDLWLFVSKLEDSNLKINYFIFHNIKKLFGIIGIIRY